MKFEKEEKPVDPDSIPKCHPRSKVYYDFIYVDTVPSKKIAIAGRCRACRSFIRFKKLGFNFDKMKLARALHANNKILFQPEEMSQFLIRKDALYGEILNTYAEDEPETRNITEPKAIDDDGGIF